jgi:hypothetical protein
MEGQYLENLFMKGVLGSNTIEANARMCMTSAVTGYFAILGSDTPPLAYEDIELSDMIMHIGHNAREQRNDHSTKSNEKGAARGGRDFSGPHLNAGEQHEREDSYRGNQLDFWAVRDHRESRSPATQPRDQDGKCHARENPTHRSRQADAFGPFPKGARRNQHDEQEQDDFHDTDRSFT